jgi:hypothetical protein
MDNAIERPIALHKLYLPPTQSQNGNILFFASIPNLLTKSSFVERATKCNEIAVAC